MEPRDFEVVVLGRAKRGGPVVAHISLKGVGKGNTTGVFIANVINF